MFKHILVPLDGSSLAEAILPAAKSLSLHLAARLTLLHVVEPGGPTTVHGEAHLPNAEAAQVYLKRLVDRLQQEGVQADWHVDVVEQGNVAKTIFAHTGELGTDLVMLATHGENGLRGIVFGSIAQQVVKSGGVPVFMLRPEWTPATFDPGLILVPLDGSAVHEPALHLAAELAPYFNARLHLVVVVPTLGTLSAERAATGALLPTSTKAMLDLAQNGAVEYLELKVQALKARGLTVSASVERGAPGAEILKVASRSDAGLVVMGTHGRAGLSAFWEGSVTPKVLEQVHAPVLLLRVFGPEPVR
ncbi:MAG: universal stress protein [Anaerolineae bacterium]